MNDTVLLFAVVVHNICWLGKSVHKQLKYLKRNLNIKKGDNALNIFKGANAVCHGIPSNTVISFANLSYLHIFWSTSDRKAFPNIL